jgi:hypothetical protein
LCSKERFLFSLYSIWVWRRESKPSLSDNYIYRHLLYTVQYCAYIRVDGSWYCSFWDIYTVVRVKTRAVTLFNLVYFLSCSQYVYMYVDCLCMKQKKTIT